MTPDVVVVSTPESTSLGRKDRQRLSIFLGVPLGIFWSTRFHVVKLQPGTPEK